MPDGNIEICGHMVAQPSFDSLQQLEESEWLKHLKNSDTLPSECIRCKQEEELGQKSIRNHAFDRHKILKKYHEDYLIIGGILDNICNSACQFCNENLSTKIGSLKFGKYYKLVNNYNKFVELPQDRIIELDINGGEPSNSPNYQNVLENLPQNLKILRINTNCSKFIDNLPSILEKKIKVIVTISLDGVGKVFEYARYPLKWYNFNNVLHRYLALRSESNFLELDFWTTLSVYTIEDFTNIENFAKLVNIPLSYGILHEPDCLSIKYKNPFNNAAKTKLINNELQNLTASDKDNSEQLFEYIKVQDKIRGTNFITTFPELYGILIKEGL